MWFSKVGAPGGGGLFALVTFCLAFFALFFARFLAAAAASASSGAASPSTWDAILALRATLPAAPWRHAKLADGRRAPAKRANKKL